MPTNPLKIELPPGPFELHVKIVKIMLWLNLNKINQYFNKLGNLSFHIRVLGSENTYPCSQTVSTVRSRLPALPPLHRFFLKLFITSVTHLEAAGENIDFHTAENNPRAVNTFSLSLAKFVQFALTYNLTTDSWIALRLSCRPIARVQCAALMPPHQAETLTRSSCPGPLQT